MSRIARLIVFVTTGMLLLQGPVAAQEYGPGSQLLVPPTVEAGATIVVEGNACGANQLVTFFIDGVQVGQTTTNDDADGYFRAEITVPAGTAAGAIEVTAVCANGEELRATLSVVPGAGPQDPTDELAFTGSSTTWPFLQVSLALITVGLLALAFGRRTGNSTIPAEDRDHAAL